MYARLALLILLAAATSLTGCTKCGWAWEQGARACHADLPK
jgi:hypothetical protein